MFGAWQIKPECGVSVRHYVNLKNGPAVAEGCARIQAASLWGFAVALTAGLLLIHLFVRKKADDVESGKSRVILPAWCIPIPVAIVGLVNAATIRTATKMFAVEQAAYVSSEMPKHEFLGMISGDARTTATVRASMASSALVSSAALLNGQLARNYGH